MDRRKYNYMEIDDEFYAQIDYIKQDYDELQRVVAMQKQDILKLIALLIEKDVAIPKGMMNRYVREKNDCINSKHIPELL